MEKEQVERIALSDGNSYSGWGYYDDYNRFIPDGCGKKYYNGYYAYGNFCNGSLDGPAIISHGSYMNTAQFKHNEGNGWGLCMNRGELVEFGFYKNGQYTVNVLDFVLWYFEKLRTSGRDDNMLNVYTFKDTHNVAEILIGYKGTPTQNEVGLCYMGFHFMADGSVWIGNTKTRRFTGNLIHFRNDGCIDCGRFEDGMLFEAVDIQTIIDTYYGYSLDDELFFSSLGYSMNLTSERKYFNNINPIIQGHNYFNGLPQAANKESCAPNGNLYSMNYHVSDIDYNANGNFTSFDEEIWTIGEKSIITPHGTLCINKVVFVDNGPLVGVQFSVNGKLTLNNFTCSKGWENDLKISTFALMRQPHNVWLWGYAFDDSGNPLVNFCGHDDLDGLAKFVQTLKRIYR